MKEWLKPEITESEAGMEVTSYLPAELPCQIPLELSAKPFDSQPK
jgi:coenzyme PQQ precursor peptide PqqA